MKTLLLAIALSAALPSLAAPAAWMTSFSGRTQAAGLVVVDGSPVVAYTSTPCVAPSEKDDPHFRNRMAITRFDATGKQLYDVEIPRPKEVVARLRGPSYGVIDGIAALPDGDLMVVAEFIEGFPWLLRVDSKTGGVRFSKAIGDPQGLTVIAAVAPVGDDVVIVGGVGAKIYFARYSANGEKRWEQSVNAGDSGSAHSVAALGDGSIVVAATSERQIILLHLDASGQTLGQRRFEGTSPQLATTRDTIGVAYDVLNTAQSLRFKALDASLAELAEVPFDAAASAQFLAAQNGSFRLFTGEPEKIRMTSFSARGKREEQSDVADVKFAVQIFDAGDYLAFVDPFFHDNGTLCGKARVARISLSKGIQ